MWCVVFPFLKLEGGSVNMEGSFHEDQDGGMGVGRGGG
jgi:hypothetical protein